MDSNTIEKRVNEIFTQLKDEGIITSETSHDQISKIINEYYQNLYGQEPEDEAFKMMFDSKINDYLNELLARVVVLVNTDENLIKKCLNDFHYHGDLSPLVNSICNFCIQNQNRISSEYIKNAKDFLTDARIRFNVSTEAFYNINKVIELANILKCDSTDFFKDEAKKYYMFKGYDTKEEDVEAIFSSESKYLASDVDRICEFECELYELISTALYKKEDDFKIRYCFSSIKYSEYLCIINYIIKDCPFLLKVDKFKSCIDYILEDSPVADFKTTIRTFISSPLDIKLTYSKYYRVLKDGTKQLNNDIKNIRS